MVAGAKVAALLDSYVEGRSLPGPLYYDQDVYDAEIGAIFETQWLFALNACEIPEAGDYRTLMVGPSPVIVVRGHDGVVRAFYNTCRHRGSRLCKAEKGNANRLVCPYHQWTYGLDGALLAAGQMRADFAAADYPLKPLHVENLCGMIYICLAEVPPDFEAFRQRVTPYIAPHRPDRLKVAYEQTIIEKANWKLVIENNRECYHCAGSHPELLVSLVEAALPDDDRDAGFGDLMRRKGALWDGLGLPHEPVDGGLEFRCIRLPFHEGVLSMTMDGKPASKKLLGDLTEPDLGSVRMFRVPLNWNHFLSDHIIHFRALPRGPYETEVRTVWFVHEDAIEGWDYDPERLAEVWRATNDQDRILAEENFVGVQSRAYEPGPNAPVGEFMVTNFLNWYTQAMRAHLPAEPIRRSAAE